MVKRSRTPGGTCASRMCLPASLCLQMTSPHLPRFGVTPSNNNMRRAPLEDCQHLQGNQRPRPRPNGPQIRPLCSRCAIMVEETEEDGPADCPQDLRPCPPSPQDRRLSPTPGSNPPSPVMPHSCPHGPLIRQGSSGTPGVRPRLRSHQSWNMHDTHRCTAWTSLDCEDVVELAPASHWADCDTCSHDNPALHAPSLMMVHPAWRESCCCINNFPQHQHLLRSDSDNCFTKLDKSGSSGRVMLWGPQVTPASSQSNTWDRRSPCREQQQPLDSVVEKDESLAGTGQHVYQAVVDRYQNVAGEGSSQEDLTCLMKTLDRLHKCGFYYGKLSMPEAKRKLQKCPKGTFLLRESSDSKFLFSLSVHTTRGTTSIRVVYNKCRFSLECATERARSRMPSAPCVLQLIEMYLHQPNQPQQDHQHMASAGSSDSSSDAITDVKQGGSSSGNESNSGGSSGSSSSGSNSCVFYESSGRCDTPVMLSRPLLQHPHSLRHLCRLRLNLQLSYMSPASRHTAKQDMSLAIRGYLQEYPYYA